MRVFHIILQPGDFHGQCPPIDLDSKPARPILDVSLVPFEISFESASDHLNIVPRLFLEPDGSFVWVGGDDEDRWQLDGMLYDRDGQLLYVEMKGWAPEADLRRFLTPLGAPLEHLTVQRVREGILLAFNEFVCDAYRNLPANP